ncbi:Hypothetical predicted protein [Lecanosticta acicola]|uniref:Uncharacterized protein n=1 Tax=Lecanosticta acicola TaxID=111012 RepID=A0AAI9EDY8_9PEZI|nr:Hypothetical predicted protein [Lecanosticta acicola]
MAASSSSRWEETNALVDFRWNLFSATAIFQTSVGARRMPKKTKRRGRAVVKPAKKVLNDIPIQEHSFSPAQLAPAVTTDTQGKLLSSATRRMQQDIRAHYQERLQQRADRASLEVLETALQRQSEARADQAAWEDLQSLALLDRAAAKLNNKLTHCTPPYQPTLWERPTRETSSASQAATRTPTPTPPARAASSQRTLGSSFAIFSSKAGHEAPRSSQQDSHIARSDALLKIDPLDAEAQHWLEAELAAAMSSSNPAPSPSSRKRDDDLQTSSSPSRSMRASGRIDRWLGRIDGAGDARSELIPAVSRDESSFSSSSSSSQRRASEGEIVSLSLSSTGDDVEGEIFSAEGDEDQCRRFDFGSETLRELERLDANIRDLENLSEASLDLAHLRRSRGNSNEMGDWEMEDEMEDWEMISAAE